MKCSYQDGKKCCKKDAVYGIKSNKPYCPKHYYVMYRKKKGENKNAPIDNLRETIDNIDRTLVQIRETIIVMETRIRVLESKFHGIHVSNDNVGRAT